MSNQPERTQYPISQELQWKLNEFMQYYKTLQDMKTKGQASTSQYKQLKRVLQKIIGEIEELGGTNLLASKNVNLMHNNKHAVESSLDNKNNQNTVSQVNFGEQAPVGMIHVWVQDFMARFTQTIQPFVQNSQTK